MTIEHTHFRQSLQRTPFHDRIVAMSTTEEWMTWNTYKVARVVDKLSTEYFAVRSGCAVMDLTPMEKYRIKGKDAHAYLDRLVTRDLSKLRPGRVTYIIWCNDEGKVIDDGTLFQLGESDYRLCSQHHQLDWLLMSAAGFDVNIETETHDVAALAVQGPTSYSVLTAAGISNLHELKPFGIANLECGDIPVTVSRTGFTGDLGYEIWVDNDHALPLWDALVSAGAPYGLLPAGLDAYDMCRVEAGFIMNGVDYFSAHHCMIDGRKSTPYELGLGWTVQLERESFVGQQALRDEKARGPRRKLVGLVLDWDQLEALYAEHGLPPEVCAHPWRDGVPVYATDGRQVGKATSGSWSPLLKQNLALADVEAEVGALGTQLDFEVTVEYERRMIGATVVRTPFFDPPRKKA